jgi:hypothetical protein
VVLENGRVVYPINCLSKQATEANDTCTKFGWNLFWVDQEMNYSRVVVSPLTISLLSKLHQTASYVLIKKQLYGSTVTTSYSMNNVWDTSSISPLFEEVNWQ